MSESRIPDALFDRYLAGDCSAAERAMVESAIGGEAADAMEVFVAETATLDRPVTTPQLALARFHARRAERDTAHAMARVPTRVSVRTRSITPWVWACAAAVVVGVAGLWTYRSTSAPTPATASATMLDQRTASGQRARITLPDGSSVVLGPDSRIRYAVTFGAETRDVWLDGEALFTVTQHTAHPFVVHAGVASTRVLGTSFTVRRYANDSDVRVVVAQGRVALGNAVLATGEMGRTADGQRVSVVRNVDIAAAIGWADGRLVLNEIPLRDAVRDIERWYGITITVRDPALLDKRVATTLTTEGAHEALSVLAIALDARVTFTGTHATGMHATFTTRMAGGSSQ